MSERKGKEKSSSSEASVKFSSSAHAERQTPARPSADAASITKAKKTEKLIRNTIEEATHITCHPDDPRPRELLKEAEKHGANYAVLAAWIHWKADAKHKRGNAIHSNGFFTRELLRKELPAFIAREPWLIKQLTDPAILAHLYSDIEGNANEPSVLATCKAASHSSQTSIVSAEVANGPSDRGIDLASDELGDCDSEWNEAPAEPPTPKEASPNGTQTQAQSLKRKPPACVKCNDFGTVTDRNGNVVRCNCPASEHVDEKFLKLANRYRGKPKQAGGAG